MSPAQHTDWLTDDGQYSEEKFYCHSTDGKGHAESLRVNVPPPIMAQISKMIQSNQFPDYSTAQDITRDALIHRLRFLATMKGDRELLRIIEFEMRNAERARKLHMLERMQFALEETERLFKMAHDLNDAMMLIDAINDARGELSAGTFMVEPWRSKMAELIDRYDKKLNKNK